MDDDSPAQRFVQAAADSVATDVATVRGEKPPARRFLQQAADDFEADLAAVFDGRSSEFTPQLRAHLFELWARARRRPAAPSSQALELAGLEARFRELLETELDEVMLSSKLARVVIPGSNVRLEQQGHLVRLEVDAGALEIPELASGSSDDELQRGLRKRLAREGLSSDGAWLEESEFLAVRMHEASGTLVGLDINCRRVLAPTPVTTLLWHDAGSWHFPRPRPTHDYSNNDHVQLFVDGNAVPEPNVTMVWTQDGTEVESVTIPGAASTSSVRAVYQALQADYF